MIATLVISSDDSTVDAFRLALSSVYSLTPAKGLEEALSVIGREHFDIIFVDLLLLDPADGYKTVLQPIKNAHPALEIVVIANRDQINVAVEAVKAGANGYLLHPVIADEIKLIADNITASIIQRSELNYLRDKVWDKDLLEIIHTHSPAMQRVYEKIRSVAPTRTTVLLIGETGVGKGLLAKLIHRHSHRDKAQLISVHCGAIPDTLLESELFGHEKGAFTGAVRKKLGKFEIAKGGTIFLDEIGTITPPAQIKLLQILQDGTFHRVGGEELIESNARVIVATNADLKKMTAEGQFRKDLYYRLNVFPIDIPPLRERISDIPLLVGYFLKSFTRTHQKQIIKVDPRVIDAMQRYAWPGNIRELENLMERAIILECSAVLTPASFPGELFESDACITPSAMSATLPLAEARRLAIDEFERFYLQQLMRRHKGRINPSAEEAGITTRQLHKLMLKHRLRKEDFKK